LKYKHSLSTRQISIEIAKSLDLNDNDLMIAEIIGLLHDSGRFPQFYEYHTFRDSISRNHSELGIDLIKKHKVLDSCNDEEREIIITSIQNHNSYSLPENLNERVKKFCRIIRDADKIDIYRVMVEDQFIMDMNSEGKPSDRIINTIRNYKCAFNDDIENETDFRLLQLSWIFDIYYAWTFKQLYNQDLLNKFYKTIIPYPEVKEIYAIVSNYLKDKLNDI